MRRGRTCDGEAVGAGNFSPDDGAASKRLAMTALLHAFQPLELPQRPMQLHFHRRLPPRDRDIMMGEMGKRNRRRARSILNAYYLDRPVPKRIATTKNRSPGLEERRGQRSSGCDGIVEQCRQDAANHSGYTINRFETNLELSSSH